VINVSRSESEEADSPFDIVSETSVSKRDQYRNILTAWVYAPAVIVWNDWRARVGTLIILFYILMGTVGVMIIEPPAPFDGPELIGPFEQWAYPLGTTGLGENLLKQVVHATPSMLEMMLSGALFSTVMATIVGTLSGYKAGRMDRVLMTFTDILLTIPGLPLVIVIAVIFEPRSPWLIGIILTINAWAGLARAIRSQVLTLREESFVEASRVMGAPTRMILTKDVIPGVMPYIAVNFVNSSRRVIFSSVGLYFLGILPFSNTNWGVMMNLAYGSGGALYTLETAHWLLVPMITIVILSLGLILFAQGTDRIFNPRVRARHAAMSDEAEDVEPSPEQ
jgi:peptide/nickel transport system permease protein